MRDGVVRVARRVIALLFVCAAAACVPAAVDVDASASPPDTDPSPADAASMPCDVARLVLDRPWPFAVAATGDPALSVRSSITVPVTFEVCTDPMCAAPVRSIVATAPSARVDPPLAPGRYFWRARDASGASTPPRQLRVGGRARVGRRPFDFDGDGLADIVACTNDASIRDPVGPSQVVIAFRGQRSGTPRALPAAALDCSALATDAGDVNGDGFSDVLLAPPSSTRLETGPVVLALGGACDPLSGRSTLEVVGPARSVGFRAVGDVNGDGYDDLLEVEQAAAPATECALTLRLGDRTMPATNRAPLGTLPSCDAIAAILDDWSGDGLPDIAVSAWSYMPMAPSFWPSGAIYVFAPGAALTATPFVVIPPPDDTGIFGAGVVDAGDIDGDGYDELACFGNRAQGIEVRQPLFVVRHDGSVAPPHVLDAVVHFPPSFAGAGDVSGDGVDDLVIGEDDGVYLASGGSDLETAHVFEAAGFTGTDEGFVVDSYGDVDGDGFPDVVAAQANTTVAAVLSGGTTMPRVLARLDHVVVERP